MTGPDIRREPSVSIVKDRNGNVVSHTHVVLTWARMIGTSCWILIASEPVGVAT